ncbi:acyltransferase family protein [Acinetobacter johnsonii]|uniref:acyltransferase family protein n=1 Tax=Acinetobacter johnsonii TaxID=40214 RepID=UPI0003823517
MRFEALTGLRGYAALYVVVYHLLNIPFPTFKSNGYLAVDLFFMLSGFLLVHNYSSLLKKIHIKYLLIFLNHRFSRIFPVYIFWLLLSLIYGLNNNETYSLSQIASNLTLTHLIFHEKSIVLPSWSVSVEWILYSLFPLLFLFIENRTIKTISTIFCFLLYFILAFQLFPFLMGSQNRSNGQLDIFFFDAYATILRGFAGFVIGMCSYSLISHSFVDNKRQMNILFYCTISLIIVLLNLKNYDFFIVILFSLLIPLCSTCDNFITKFLSNKLAIFLGEISYSLYLCHLLLFPIINNVIANQYISLAIIMCISYLTFKLIEKPCIKIFKYRKQVPAYQQVLNLNRRN